MTLIYIGWIISPRVADHQHRNFWNIRKQKSDDPIRSFRNAIRNQAHKKSDPQGNLLGSGFDYELFNQWYRFEKLYHDLTITRHNYISPHQKKPIMRFLLSSIHLLLPVDSALRRGFGHVGGWVGWANGQERKIHAWIDSHRYPLARRLIITFHRYQHKMTLSKLLDRVFLAIYKSKAPLVVKLDRSGIFSPRMLVGRTSSWWVHNRIICFTTKHIFELGKNDFEYSGRPLVSMWGGGLGEV